MLYRLRGSLEKLSPHWAPHLRRLLRDHANLDTDKPEVHPVSESERMHSWIIPEGELVKLRAILLWLPVHL